MDQQQQWMDYSTFDHRALSLNLSGLSVASPATPVTPSATPYHHQPFAYDGPYEHTPPPVTLRTARSKKAPSPTVTVSVEPADDDSRLYDDEARDAPMELADAASYDFASAKHGPLSVVVDSSANGTGSAGGTSPVEGSNSPDDPYGTTANGNAMGSSMNVLGKPLATNNFVTKLYQYVCASILIDHAHSTQDDQRPKVSTVYRVDRARYIVRRLKRRRVQQEHSGLAFQA